MFVLLFISCATPFLKIKSDVLVQPAPTLMTTAVINTVVDDSEVDLFDMIQSKEMNEVGLHLISQSIEMLDGQGFQVYMDKEQVQALSMFEGDVTETEESLSKNLGGVWFSNEASQTVIHNSIALPDSCCSSLVDQLNTERKNEHFLFVSARLSEVESFFIMRSVRILIDYVIFNEEGIAVFRARGIGKGKQSFLFADKSKNTLFLIIEDAIQRIGAESKQEL